MHRHDGDGFTSRSLTEEDLSMADYVIITSKQLKFTLPKSDKIYTFGELTGCNELKEPCVDEFVTFLDATADIEFMSDIFIQKLKQI